MNIHKLVSMIVVSMLVAILFASALNSYTRVADSALAAVAPTATPRTNAPLSILPAKRDYLPIIFLNSANAGGAWLLSGNAGTNPNNDFLGTTDNVTLTFRVSNTIAYRIVPATISIFGFAPSIIGGYNGNTIAPGVPGATIAGGGLSIGINSIGANGNFSFIGGGASNTANGYEATVSGGYGNLANASTATVGGGHYNAAYASDSTVSGGYANTANSSYSTVSGGTYNAANGNGAFIGGGGYNGTSYAGNIASGNASTIVGGFGNTISVTGSYASIGGGQNNTANGQDATIPGGYSNQATMTGTFAAGNRAQAINQGAFVWADSTDAPFASTGNDQFLIRANGGVGINTNAPQATLDISGSLRVNTGGTVFNRIQAGTSSVPTSTVASTVFTITFPSAFSTMPQVIATPRGQDLDDTFVVTTRRISTTYAVFNVIRIDQSAGWTQNLQLDWFAWE